MSNNSKSLSWNDRFALIEHFNLTDDQVIDKMGVTQDQLDTARDMLAAGTFRPTPNLDCNSYSKMVGASATSATKPTKTSAPTSVTKPTAGTTSAPQTANKPLRTPKKRGRKGDKIANAFGAIPTGKQSAVPAEQFATDNNVSLYVLRQSKRFDTNPAAGIVHVKKDKATKTLMIWREETND